jgi:hypothetical protein
MKRYVLFFLSVLGSIYVWANPAISFANCFQVHGSSKLGLAVASEEMVWFDAGTGIPVLRFVKNGKLISTYFAFAIGQSISFKKINKSAVFNLYLNPIVNELNLPENNEIIGIKIIDVTEKLTHHNLRRSIKLESLNKGMCDVKIISTNKEAYIEKNIN